MTTHSTETTDRAAAREQLSALIDGELGETESAQACLLWRGDAETRASWHAYQLIGDVLRSDDLGSTARHDAAFLAALRGRLAHEPVVLAPQAVQTGAGPLAARMPVGRRRWRTPVAAAAGFVAVVGVVIATRFTVPTPGDAGSALARSDSGSTQDVAASGGGTTPVSAAAPVTALDARGLVASGQLIRDVRLDRYLSAHKQFAGSSALGVPSGFLRNATADAAER